MVQVKRIRKRDGRIVDFKQKKITQAIREALQATSQDGWDEAKTLSDMVVQRVNKKFSPGNLPSVEDIQDIVEHVLMDEGYNRTAKAYILYRKHHQDLREIESSFNKVDMVEDYVGKESWRVKENSNMSYSLQGLNVFLNYELISNYWLTQIYTPEIKRAHETGKFHIHDLGVLGPYCVGWDLKDLLKNGFKGVRGKIASKPAKHLSPALLQTVNFMYTLQGEAAGAQAISNVDTYLAPFIHYDDISYEELKQKMQEFLFNMNVPTRVGFQTPFTNMTFDLTIPEYLKDEPVIIGGEEKDATYGEFQEEVNMFNKAFAEVMMEGDADDRPFTFPIPTYNITPDFNWDREVVDKIMEMTAKYGIPYFANFVRSDMSPEDARSMCCRLRLDKRELKKRGGGLFGSNPLTGSIGVVTINLPQIGYLAKNEAEFFELLEKRMDLAKESLIIKRKVLEKFTKRGLYPYSKFYLRNVKKWQGEYWSHHFSTIGLNGMNDALINFLNTSIATEEGVKFAEKVLEFMRGRLKDYQEETGHLWNLEATPAEGTCYRLAKIDKKRFPDIKTYTQEKYGEGNTPYYTNSTQLPAGYTNDIFKALDLQDPLQTKYTGGTVLHGFLGEKMPSVEATKRLIKKVVNNYELPYFSLTPTFSICSNHGYLSGEHQYCPKCEQEGNKTKCEVYSRVVGYLRPVNQWNKGKRQEYEDREEFNKQVEKIKVRT